jgi:pimeloyl-ACP methyl ester carboxylesterase
MGDERDRPVEEAQKVLLARYAPETSVRRVRWSRGEVQVLELGAGHPLLLLHGAFGMTLAWAPILAALARQRHVVAVDLPGHGLADPFDYSDVDLLQTARVFLGEVLDALTLPQVDVMAHSVGGLFAVAFALAEPERVHRLVLAGAPAGVRRPGVPLQLRLFSVPLAGPWLARRLMQNPTLQGAKKLWGQILVAHPERVDEAMLVADVETQRRDLHSYLSILHRLADIGGVRREFMLGASWEAVDRPVLVLWGTRDAFAPSRWGEELAARNAAIRFVRIPEAGHLPWLDDPQLVVAEAEHFLAA